MQIVKFLFFFLIALLGFFNPSNGKPHGHISLVRRDGDGLDSLLTEYRAKGSRMRFGKRSSKENFGPEGAEMAGPYYAPYRFIWLQ